MVKEIINKMKIFIDLCIYLLVSSCSNLKYYGYVYDFEIKKPLENVKVYDVHDKKMCTTNKEGYFEINYLKNHSSILVFQKQYYKSDTIPSISILSGELSVEKFKGEVIYLFNENSRFKDSIINLNSLY